MPAAGRLGVCECGAELWKRRGGDWTLANRVLKLVDGGLVAKCPECRRDVPVPFLTVAPEAVAEPARVPPRLVVRTA